MICALSGGVDSTVAATLVHKALGDRLHCIFVDNGLLRLKVLAVWLQLVCARAQLCQHIGSHAGAQGLHCAPAGTDLLHSDAPGWTAPAALCSVQDTTAVVLRALPSSRCTEQAAEHVMATFVEHLHLTFTHVCACSVVQDRQKQRQAEAA